MSENKLKHMEFIQAVIIRMAANSFLIRGWSVTLLAAIFALAAKDSDQSFILVAYLPIAIFWGLDAYYTGQERRYRGLYDEVVLKTENSIDFSMNASNSGENAEVWKCLLWGVVPTFHGVLMGVNLLVMFVFPHFNSK